MKNLRNYLVLFLVCSGIVFFNSCSDNYEFNSDNNIAAIEKVLILENVPYIQNPYDTEKYLEVYEDLDDKKINRSLYEVSLIAREILKSNEWNELIISKAKENRSSTMNINEFVLKSNLKSENVHFTNLKEKLQNIDLTHISMNPMKSGTVENYIPAFFVPNIEIADFNKQVIICPGIVVNSELSGAEDLKDYIVGWTFTNGEWKEFLLNEETAMSTPHPILIVDNASEYLMNVPPIKYTKLSEGSKLKSINTQVQMKVSTYEYRLDYRFEDSGNSSFYISCLHIDGNGTYHGPIDGLNYSLEQEIASVKKGDIGKDLTKWFDIARGNYDPIESQALVWNTFERDWFRSRKSLGKPTWAGATFHLDGNMHYDADWYGCKPEKINDYIVKLSDLHSNWLFGATSEHGYLGIWRTAY